MRTHPILSAALALVLVASLAASASAQSYCTPQHTGVNCSYDEYISNVTISDLTPTVLLNNSTTCQGPPAYQDFTATVPPMNLVGDLTYTVSVTLGSPYTSDYARVWLDANQNFSFEDAGESLLTLSFATGATQSGTITIPTTALSGPTRLRVRMIFSSWPTPPSCGNTTWGDCEDYAVVVGNPLPPQYQVNQPGSTMTLDGVQGTAYTPAVTSKCANTFGNVVFASNVPGTLWEAALALSPLVPLSAGGIPLPGNQIVNVNFADPTLFYLWGGPVPQLVPFSGYFAGSFNTGSFPGAVSIQQINIHPSLPGGFALSQGCQLNVVGFSMPPTPIAGPTSDDSEVVVNVGCVAIYGRSFSTIHVESNGRLMFGGGNTYWTPTVAQFATDAPSFGVWCDFNPATPGSGQISINSPTPGIIDVFYNGIYYIGTTLANTFNLQLNTGTNVASLIGLNTLSVNTSQQLIGISGGNSVLATDPGPVNFSPGGTWTTGITSNSTDMIYMLGTQGTLTTGISRVDFFLNVYNNYNWVSF